MDVGLLASVLRAPHSLIYLASTKWCPVHGCRPSLSQSYTHRNMTSVQHGGSPKVNILFRKLLFSMVPLSSHLAMLAKPGIRQTRSVSPRDHHWNKVCPTCLASSANIDWPAWVHTEYVHQGRGLQFPSRRQVRWTHSCSLHTANCLLHITAAMFDR